MILRFFFKRMLSVVITLTVIANTVSLLLFTGLSLLNGDGSTDHVHMFAEVAKNDTLDGGVGGGICHRMEFFTHSFLSRFSQLSETVQFLQKEKKEENFQGKIVLWVQVVGQNLFFTPIQAQNTTQGTLVNQQDTSTNAFNDSTVVNTGHVMRTCALLM